MGRVAFVVMMDSALKIVGRWESGGVWRRSVWRLEPSTTDLTGVLGRKGAMVSRKRSSGKMQEMWYVMCVNVKVAPTNDSMDGHVCGRGELMIDLPTCSGKHVMSRCEVLA